MSFTRLESGEFPPLNAVNANANGSKVRDLPQQQEASDSIQDISEDVQFRAYLNSTKKQKHDIDEKRISPREEYSHCRIGYQLCDYKEDLGKILTSRKIAKRVDFILAPIIPIRPSQYDNKFEAIPDIILPHNIWQSKVAINLGYPPLDNYHVKSIKSFDRLLRHALYLSASTIVITCPNSDLGIVSLASIVNDRLSHTQYKCSVLFRVSLISEDDQKETPEFETIPKITSSENVTASSPIQSSSEKTSTNSSPQPQNPPQTENLAHQQTRLKSDHKNLKDPWKLWNNLRSHLKPDPRIGVCLSINDELSDDQEELDRWAGEPVHMLIIHSDLFVRSTGPNYTPYLSALLRNFISKIARAVSFKLDLVLESQSDQDVREYLKYIKFMLQRARYEHDDFLIGWDNKMQSPLQPLSVNLDSGTYGVFEQDSTKYVTYQKAMLEALHYIIDKFGKERRKFILMVLGAGRGPLVDAMIRAIEELMGMKREMTKYRFKIYALDKNHCSVRSLIYKQKNEWINDEGYYETEVVESDMRTWEPGVKADIIATELLGSFSDNELSPECIDGVWRFSTSQTISIPREYSSYIAPICSYQLYQDLFKRKVFEPNSYDQIYVVKLANYYLISEPQALFEFEHEDLSLPPAARCNERYSRLVFESKVETVCHGFAGYFEANLIGDITLSTVINQETPSMYSWFPAFIPLENPIQLEKGTKIIIHFWRKESSTTVWYQWVVTQPERSRLYSQDGVGTAMSKFI